MEPLDGISLGVFSYLKQHPRVVRLEHKTLVGATSAQLGVWEQKNFPCILPDDLKRFFTITNGLSVKWYTTFKGHETLVGHFGLNGIQDLQKSRVDNFGALCRPADRHRLQAGDESVTAFPLENLPKYGEVALVFFGGDRSQIWFRDLRGQWSFLASNFTNYHRMMIAHLGLISWQTIFSDVEMDPSRKPWFYLFIPQRMVVDEQELATPAVANDNRTTRPTAMIR